MNSKLSVGLFFIFSALFLLLFGLFMGAMASHTYIIPGFWKSTLNFSQLRPLHVSSVLFWILLSSIGAVYAALPSVCNRSYSNVLALVQWGLWFYAIVGIMYSYFQGVFGGREYWEFPASYALPIAVSWVLFLINYLRATCGEKDWPIYKWMWLTGICFFLFTFAESYLWQLPYIRENIVKDMTIQWKANGSMVGSWNQLVYGTAFYLMEKISGQKDIAKSRAAFAMYFLGLTNLMFNWGHHIYTLPTEPYVRIVSYVVSMTEWIILGRILWNWRKSLTDMQRQFHVLSYRFIAASEVWLLLNLLLALLMSIPSINLYTHGTHITVAHAMGTTIGINSMILFAAGFHFFGADCKSAELNTCLVKYAYWTTQVGLLVFWLSLIAAGIVKSFWQMSSTQIPYSRMMDSLQPYFMTFVIAGSLLMLSIGLLAIKLCISFGKCTISKKSFSGSQLHNLKYDQKATRSLLMKDESTAK